MNLLSVISILLLFIGCDNILTNLKHSQITGGDLNTSQTAPSFNFQVGNVLSGKWLPQNPPAFNERCAAVTTDNEGNIYCAGHTASGLFDTNSTNQDDILMFKISPLGNLIWAKQIGETAGVPGGDTTQRDSCAAIALYDGAVYCSGRTRGSIGHAGSGANECIATKLRTSNGEILWTRQFTSVSCDGIGVDSTGVYLGGGTSVAIGEAPGGSSDILVIKLNHDGTDAWIRQLGAVTPVPGNTLASESCRDLAVDGEGGVYCGGVTKGGLGETFGGSADIFIAKFNTNGDLLWLSQLGADTSPTGSSGNDICWSVAVNANGPFCGGRTTGSLGDTNSGTGAVDTLIAHFNKITGDVEWIHQIGNSSTVPVNPLTNGSGVCDEVTTDSNNNVYCGGRTGSSLFEGNAGNQDAMAYKLSPVGEHLWGFQLGLNSAVGDASLYDTIYGMAVRNGQAYFGGETSGSLFETSAGNRDLIFFTAETSTGKLSN